MGVSPQAILEMYRRRVLHPKWVPAFNKALDHDFWQYYASPNAENHQPNTEELAQLQTQVQQLQQENEELKKEMEYLKELRSTHELLIKKFKESE